MSEPESGEKRSTTWEAIKNRVTITCAFIFMSYVGAEGKPHFLKSFYARALKADSFQ